MAEAAIFIIEKIKQTTGLSALSFNSRSGYVVKFTLGNIVYRRVEKQDFRDADQKSDFADGGYYPEEKFLDYLAKRITLKEINTTAYNIGSLKDAVAGDQLKVRKLKVVSPYSDFCKVNDFSWAFEKGHDYFDADFNILIPSNASVTVTDIPVNNTARDFYNRNIGLLNSSGLSAGEKDQAAYLIALIALRIDSIHRDVFTLFTGDANFSNYIASQDLEWSTGNFLTPMSLPLVNQYNNSISNFYNSAYSNQRYIVSATSDTKLYWLASILPVSALTVIPAYNKLKILQLIAKGVILGAISGIVPFAQNDEEFVVNIARSVNELQADEFLTGLTAFYMEDGTNSICLFQSLYDKVNDQGVGENNLKLLIQELYRIFLLSSNNPYNLDGSVKDNLINPGNYLNKPVQLDYEAGYFLWLFNSSNYDFRFKKNRIQVYYSVTEIAGETATEHEKIVGTYDIYQTVTVNNTDANTGQNNFIAVKVGDSEQAALPIFYLKYIDDKKETENLVIGVKLTVDILLTATGIGNLGKLRHLRTIYKLGRAALGLETVVAGDVLATYEFAQGVLGVVEITGSVGNIFIEYSKEVKSYCDENSSEYDQVKCERYTTLNNIFVYMQLFSGALDYASSKILSNSSKRWLQGPIPDDFNPDALAILRKFAGDIDELKEVFRVRLVQQFGEDSAIWKRIENAGLPGEFTLLKRDEFIEDFGNAKANTLNALNDDSALIDTWEDVEDLENFATLRKDTGFLNDLKAIKNSEDLDVEVFKGKAGRKIKKGNPNPNLENSYTYPSTGAHFVDAFDATKNGITRIIGDKQPIPGVVGYYNAKVEMYNDYLGQWVKKKTNKGYSTFFPDHWSKKKLQQEMTLASRNKKLEFVNKEGIKIYKGRMSDGVKCIIYEENGKITSIHPSF